KFRVGKLFFAEAFMSTGSWNALNHRPYYSLHHDIGYNSKALTLLCHVVYAMLVFRFTQVFALRLVDPTLGAL
ncbi:MAG: hypothetical protein ABF291_11965, partial [Desulfobacterales bacterium]